MTDPSACAAASCATRQERGREQFAGGTLTPPCPNRNRSLPAEQRRAHFREPSPAARETIIITIGQDGVIVSCGSRAVLLK